MRLGLALAATCLVAGCTAAPVPGGEPVAVLPTVSLSYATTRLTLHVASDAASKVAAPEPGAGGPYGVQTLAGAGGRVKVTIEATDLAAPVSQTIAGPLGGSTLVIENAPAGKNRLVSLAILDDAGNPIAGTTLRAVADLAAGSQTLEISPRSTAVGDVYARLFATPAGRAAAGTAKPADVGTLLDQVKQTGSRVSHYGLIDAVSIADAIRAQGGTLPAPSAAFQVRAGTVRLTLKGAPDHVPVEVVIRDPVSPLFSGLAPLITQTGGVYDLGPVAPGTWPISVFSPLLVASGSATAVVVAGEVATASVDLSAWQAGPPLPAPIGAPGVAAIGGKIYAVGGVAPGGKATDSLFVLDTGLANPAWQRLADLPTAREGPGVGVVNGRLVVAGGQAGQDGASTRTGAVEVYEPTFNTWTSVSRLPAAFLAGSAKAIAWGAVPGAGTGTRFFAFQGIADFGVTLSAAAEYEALTDTWVTANVPAIPTPRILAAAAHLAGRIYLAGGWKAANPTFNQGTTTQFPHGARAEVEALDLNVTPKVWRAMPPLGTGRGELALAASRTKLYAAGGVGPGDKVLSIVEVYDPIARTWLYTGSLRTPRSSFGMVAANGKLWAIGGSNSRLLGFFGGGSAAATQAVEVLPLPEGSP
jgi:hypothetical protein